MATVLLIGAMDTKEPDYRWLRERLVEDGCDILLMDVGTFSEYGGSDFTPADVARAGGGDLEALREARDRGAAMAIMAEGAAVITRQLYEEGKFDGVLAAGGSGGSSVASRAMQSLPIGVPKLLVSTMASGDVGPYVGATDVTMTYSVVDVSGINAISRVVLGNAVAAIAAMARQHRTRIIHPQVHDDRPLVGASMFGLTTPAVTEAMIRLNELGYEVVVFHATGSGGRALEALAVDGFFAGVLDLTTTELADELVGGVLTAGPDRLVAVGQHGIPEVVSLGALDMVNFGGRETVPERFSDRLLVVHNSSVTLMRTSSEEMATLGSQIAAKLRLATGPVEVFIPLRGFSGIDCAGGPFEDPAADAACVEALREGLAGSGIAVHEVDSTINEPGFGRAAADALHRLITTDESNARDNSKRILVERN